MGLPWGTGETGAADGKSVEAPSRSLRSGHHFRHRLTGVSLYWLVRDDWIAARVGVIPAHDWESWHLLEAILKPLGGRPLRWAAGDTHGQHLALWGLAFLMGKEIRARFRGLGNVKLYGGGPGQTHPVEGVEPVRWDVVEQALPSLARLVEAVRSGLLSSEHLLRIANVYDEDGRNVMDGLRELGKAVRTAYVLRYACSEGIRQEVREACNRVEAWNAFEEAVFWGHGGRIQTTDEDRQEIDALCMQLVMNSIVFYNTERHGKELRRIRGATPLMWRHIGLVGEWRLTSR